MSRLTVHRVKQLGNISGKKKVNVLTNIASVSNNLDKTITAFDKYLVSFYMNNQLDVRFTDDFGLDQY